MDQLKLFDSHGSASRSYADWEADSLGYDPSWDEIVRVQEAPQTTKTRTLTPGEGNKKPPIQGSFERKMIKRKGKEHGPYLYLRWWIGGKHKSTYLGKAPPLRG
ncbi:MAG: hypothetical protein VKJ46_15955 [Leptolyngbyaceae bacterium]|nr:hypothetical protein [Leptolyngbyaceae bacterium]